MSKLWFNKNKVYMSRWALKYCILIEDDPAIREFITKEIDAMEYVDAVRHDIERLNDLAEEGKKSSWKPSDKPLLKSTNLK